MPAETQPVYLVDTSAEPVIIKVAGRATYLTCNPIHRFFEKMIDEGRYSFVIELSECTGMDSTFLGILAATAIELMEREPKGEFILTNLNSKNLELVQNLGLHRVLKIEKDIHDITFTKSLFSNSAQVLDPERPNAEVILKAHESLIQVDPNNFKKFQDVITYLKTHTA